MSHSSSLVIPIDVRTARVPTRTVIALWLAAMLLLRLVCSHCQCPDGSLGRHARLPEARGGACQYAERIRDL